MKSSYKYLFKNIGLLSLSQFGSKVLVFFLLPLYTSVLTTAEYGIYDIFHTTISLLLPIFSLNISTSLLRFPLDKSSNAIDIFSIGMKVFSVGFCVFLLLAGLNYRFHWFNVFNQYPLYLVGIYISMGVYYLISNFARGIDRVSSVAIAGIILSVSTIFLNILLLVIFRLGLIGYFIANITGPLIASTYFLLSLKLWKYISFRVQNSALQKEMLAYSIPMIITAISWWINSLSDRYIVLLFCGFAANGIYAVASKIPSMLALFQNIFNQAWILSSVKDFDANDKNGFFAGAYNYYHYLLLLGCTGIIVFTKIIAKFLYGKNFYMAWQYVPFLTIAVLIGAMSGFIGGILATKKDTKSLGISVLIGAILNVVLNLILVPLYGPLGAAFATFLSSFSIWQIRLKIVRQYICLRIPLLKHYVAYTILIFQSVLLLKTSPNSDINFLIVVLSFIILVLFYKEGKEVLLKLKNNCQAIIQKGNIKKLII